MISKLFRSPPASLTPPLKYRYCFFTGRMRKINRSPDKRKRKPKKRDVYQSLLHPAHSLHIKQGFRQCIGALECKKKRMKRSFFLTAWVPKGYAHKLKWRVTPSLTHTHTQTHLHTHTHTHMNTCKPTHFLSLSHTQTHTHNTYTHTCTHARTRSLSL